MKKEIIIDADDFNISEIETQYVYLSGETKDGKVYTAFQDLKNPENNWELIRTKEEIENEVNELKTKVKIGNYYSFDGIEYAERIETKEEVAEVLEHIEDGLCSDVYTLKEYKELSG